MTMNYRIMGRSGLRVSELCLGAMTFGGSGDVWNAIGALDEKASTELVARALDTGVTFFDTADAYGDGRSEQLIGQFLLDNPDRVVTVATKIGRRAEQVPENYTRDNFRTWLDRSRRNLQVDRIDLVQLHCPPTPVFSRDETYDALDTLVAEGVIAAYGVSVETCDEALTAIARRGTATVQIILNAFRRKPLDYVLPAAAAAGVGIIARVPLASGLLSGRYTTETQFAEYDHRNYNRQGKSFDVGETFSGVDFETGVAAAQEFSQLVRDHLGDVPPAQAALAWVVQQPGVSTVIPGARSADQARANAAAGLLPPLPQEFLDGVADLYDRRLRASIHPRW